MQWTLARIDDLSPRTLLAVLALRQQVFILEQQCLYPDIDGIDLEALHLLGHDASDALVAYLRIIPPLGKYPGPAIGRVVTAPSARGTGAGRTLMRQGMAHARAEFPGLALYLSGQTYLRRFYEDLGFVAEGEAFDEDGIEHIEMVAPARAE